MLGEGVVCTAISPRLYILITVMCTSAVLPTSLAVALQLQVFAIMEFCCVMKIAVADSKPAKELLTRHNKHFASVPTFWLETVRCQ